MGMGAMSNSFRTSDFADNPAHMWKTFRSVGMQARRITSSRCNQAQVIIQTSPLIWHAWNHQKYAQDVCGLHNAAARRQMMMWP